MIGDSLGSGFYWILQGFFVYKWNKNIVYYVGICNQNVLNVNVNVMK